MAELILVRHGQANSHATDEASYDKLSDLGHTQARWLGEHMRATNPHFDHVITGTLRRQKETAAGMGYDKTRIDGRLDELQYFAMAAALEAEHGIVTPTDPTEFASHLPKMIGYWAADKVTSVPERFADFHARTTGLIEEVCQGHGRVLLVTSGGVIGTILRHVLHLSDDGMAKIMLQVMNSSVHRLEYVHGQLMLGSFNATPHLDIPGREHARTFV